MTAKTLDETDSLLLRHEFECVELVDKATGIALFEEDFYGEPQSGLIDSNNLWAAIGGTHLTVWCSGELRRIETIKDIDSIRLRKQNLVEILTDPWSSESAIWELDLETFEFKKTKAFKAYQGKPFTENVKW